MISKTKYYVSLEEIKRIFAAAKLGEADEITELTAGEFNAAYRVKAGKGEYVLKVAPVSDDNTLTYEHGLMAREVEFYRLIAEKTDVKIPRIYAYDDSLSILPAEYFIMEYLSGKPLNTCKLKKDERLRVRTLVGEATAKLHNIKGSGFGYPQNGLKDNWYDAIRSMTENVVFDARRYGKKCKYGLKLLEIIDKCRPILEKVEPTYTHFDIWDGNIFYERIDGRAEITLIDTERGYWGDCLGEFVSIEMPKVLDKKVAVKAYNELASAPIRFTDEERIRYYIMCIYLGLIVDTEKYARYKKTQLKYLVNALAARLLIVPTIRKINRLI